MKKINFLYLIFFLFLFLLTGYVTDSGSFSSHKKDYQLKSKIYGSWMRGSNKITFFKDSTFTDSIFIPNASGDAQYLYSRTGSYTIHNSALLLKTEGWKFAECSSINDAASSSENFTLQIDGNTMVWDGKLSLVKHNYLTAR